MPNTLSQAWVKNVYSLGIQAGIKSVSLPTQVVSNGLLVRSTVHNYPTFPIVLPKILSFLSTLFLDNLPPLYRQLYPLSTEPITIRTKEN